MQQQQRAARLYSILRSAFSSSGCSAEVFNSSAKGYSHLWSSTSETHAVGAYLACCLKLSSAACIVTSPCDLQWQHASRFGSVQQQAGFSTGSKCAAAWHGLAARRLLSTATADAGAVAAKASSGAAVAIGKVSPAAPCFCSIWGYSCYTLYNFAYADISKLLACMYDLLGTGVRLRMEATDKYKHLCKGKALHSTPTCSSATAADLPPHNAMNQQMRWPPKMLLMCLLGNLQVASSLLLLCLPAVCQPKHSPLQGLV